MVATYLFNKQLIEGKTNNMRKQDGDILTSLYSEPFINQRILAEMSGHSLGTVNRALIRLQKSGFLDEHIQLTSKARSFFAENIPKNAVILAAGFGMRMVPINMETPKALLEVNGEKLIDRLISQLQEVGIEDITVIVGFMKEAFDYLKDGFGVKIIDNNEYAAKNNISSINLVADKLSNTYIVPCDIWCDRNPFRRNELYSWYMVSDIVDDASDVRINRNMELVRVPKDKGGNGMLGITYLTDNDARIVKERIKSYANNPDYDDRFWEEALYNTDKMIIQGRIVHAADVVEINTYEQLRDLDAESDQLKSDALEIIAKEFDCRADDIVDIEVLKKGMTNRSFLFSVNDEKYIMRIPGEGTDQLINRQQEAEVYKTISGLEICDDPVYINPKNGYKITKYINNVRCCDPENINDLRCCMSKLRTFHSMNLKVKHEFDIYGQIDFYESLWDGQPSIYSDYSTTKANVQKLKPFIEKHCEEKQLAHIDAVPDNFLFDPNEDSLIDIQLTDWEYAGMQDKHVDIAMFCIYSCYDKEKIDTLIDLYFEDIGGCDTIIRAKIYCYIAACGLLWSNWCEFKRNLGVEFGEYSLYQYQYGKEYYHHAVELMKEID